MTGYTKYFSLEMLNLDAAPDSQALSRLFDAAQKAQFVFEPIIESIILGPETDQHLAGFPLGDDDLLAFASSKNRGRSSLISDIGTSFTPDFRIVVAVPRPPI